MSTRNKNTVVTVDQSLTKVKAAYFEAHAHRGNHANCKDCRRRDELKADIAARDVRSYVKPND